MVGHFLTATKSVLERPMEPTRTSLLFITGHPEAKKVAKCTWQFEKRTFKDLCEVLVRSTGPASWSTFRLASRPRKHVISAPPVIEQSELFQRRVRSEQLSIIVQEQRDSGQEFPCPAS